MLFDHKIYKLPTINIIMAIKNSIKKNTILATTIIVFLLFMMLGLASYRLVIVLFDGFLEMSGIINPLVGPIIIIILSIILLVGVFHKNLLSLFKK